MCNNVDINITLLEKAEQNIMKGPFQKFQGIIKIFYDNNVS